VDLGMKSRRKQGGCQEKRQDSPKGIHGGSLRHSRGSLHHEIL
jgi:hypothetical protein